MAVIQATDLASLVKATQNYIQRTKFVSIVQEYQYHIVPQLMRKERMTQGGGTGYEWRVEVLGNDQSSNWVGLAAVTRPTINEAYVTASVPWRHLQDDWSYDIREPALNSGDKEKIFDLIKQREVDSQRKHADKMEAAFWSKPADSTDTLLPFGIPYWIVQNNTEGFNGGNASGFTAGPGGVDRSTYSGWKNYSGQYTAVNKADLIKKMRGAIRLCNFTPPVNYPSLTGETTSRSKLDYGLYTTRTVVEAFDELAEAQGELKTNDVASKDGKAMFMGMDVNWVPYLDAATSNNPIYGLAFNTWRFAYLKGFVDRRSEPMTSKDQHTVVTQFTDSTLNGACMDPRKNFVFHTGSAA
jgi:hypothetical protein